MVEKYDLVDAGIDWSVVCSRNVHKGLFENSSGMHMPDDRRLLFSHPTHLLKLAKSQGVSRILSDPSTKGVVVIEATAVANLAISCLMAVDFMQSRIVQPGNTWAIVVDPIHAHTRKRIGREGINSLTSIDSPISPDYFDPKGPKNLIERVRQFPGLKLIIATDDELPEKLNEFYKNLYLQP